MIGRVHQKPFYTPVIIFARLAEFQSDKKDLNAEIFFGLVVFRLYVCSYSGGGQSQEPPLLALGLADPGLQGVASLLGVA